MAEIRAGTIGKGDYVASNAICGLVFHGENRDEGAELMREVAQRIEDLVGEYDGKVELVLPSQPKFWDMVQKTLQLFVSGGLRREDAP